MYSQAISSPFRENNYEPELVGVIHTDYDLFGLRGRFINIGLVHQSNGWQEPLSPSRNRICAQFGFERGGFGLMVGPWYRIQGDWTVDNNPDITTYMGYGESLIDYNHAQTTVGAGLLLIDCM